QVFNYARENAHLKNTYKILFDSISVSRVQTETKISSLQNELQSNIYKNAKLRTQLFKKVSDQKDNTQDSSKNTKFAKQPNVEILPKIGETNALSKLVTSNLVSSSQEPKGVNNDKVITPGMFRINPSKTSRNKKNVPNTVSTSTRTKPITVSQTHDITKKDVNSDLNGLSSTLVDNTKTRRPKPRSNTKNDRVPSASKSSRSKNKEAKVEEHHRNLLLSKNNEHISSRGRKHKANVSKNETQQKNQPEIKKPKKVGFIKRLATPKPRKSRLILRWSPTGKLFDTGGKIVDYNESKSTSICSNDLFEAMYDDYFGGEPSATERSVSPVQEPQVHRTSTASTTIADTALIPTNSSSHATNIPNTSQDVDELNSNDMVDGNTFVNPFANSSTSAAASSSLQNVDPSNIHTFYQPYHHEFQWTKDHPLEQVIGEPSRPVLTRNQLRSDGDMCMYALTVSIMEPKNVNGYDRSCMDRFNARRASLV
nr:hypothetical protein [Tanacetum cinerariifolium]